MRSLGLNEAIHYLAFMAIEDTLPTVNWPKRNGDYRVVQIEIQGKPYILFEGEHDFTHASIILTLGQKLKKEVRESLPSKLNLSRMVPDLSSDWYQVHGMGFALFSPMFKRASFHGKSSDYELGINREKLELVRGLEPQWRIEYRG